MEPMNCSHSGNSGDILASIPVMKEYYRLTGRKISLRLIKYVRAFYYTGATHPIKNSEGEMVMLNEAAINMLRPLLMAQECIEEVICTDEDEKEGVIRLHDFRETNVGMPALSINRWYFYVFPDLACDLSKPWLTVPDSEKDLAKGKIMITRTERYQNNADYSFLKPYEDELIFSGTMREYNQFCMMFDLNIKKLTVTSFLDIAQAIKQSRFHISNQTMAYQISTGLKHPSILEVCTAAPNCIPIGENQYDFLAQHALEYYFAKLYGNVEEHIEKVKASQK